MRNGFSGCTMAIGTADVVVYSKQKGFAISCTESAKDPKYLNHRRIKQPLRIRRDGDQHSELISITIPK